MGWLPIFDLKLRLRIYLSRISVISFSDWCFIEHLPDRLNKDYACKIHHTSNLIPWPSWQISYIDSNCYEVHLFPNFIENMSWMVRANACRKTDDKPLHETLITKFNEALWCHKVNNRPTFIDREEQGIVLTTKIKRDHDIDMLIHSYFLCVTVIHPCSNFDHNLVKSPSR